ncbi:integrase [Serratia sp. 3ACOL1]|jgi:hypothetical protein|nr:integrase [Serratia sp. 3ACOL1]
MELTSWTKREKTPSAKIIETMKPGDKDKADTGENRTLRITCGVTPNP